MDPLDQGHPIPQDVTGFQFKLIGDITIKEFAYLGVGILIAWFVFSLPIFLIIKIPIAIIIVGLTLIFVFVPIQGRSADVMLGLFLKALIKPNSYKYILKPKPVTKESELNKDSKKVNSSNNLFAPVEPKTVPERPVETRSTSSVAPHILSEENASEKLKPKIDDSLNEKQNQPANEEKNEEKVEKKEEIKETKDIMDNLKNDDLKNQPVLHSEEAHQRALALEKQLQQSQKEKEELERRLVELEKKLNLNPNDQVFTPSLKTENVKTVPLGLQKSTGTPLVNDIPNLINGVVKNPRGEVLPNILIEIEDSKSNPVRAFKTNQLGQFASATPLTNGMYKIIFEDPSGKNTFDKIKIEAKGEVIPPLEVISLDEREKLRKQLFG